MEGAGGDKAGNPWASHGSASQLGGGNDPFARGNRRYDALLGALPSMQQQPHLLSNHEPSASLFVTNAAGVPGGVFKPGAKRRANYQQQEIAYEQSDVIIPDEDDRPRRYRKGVVPNVIGEGESYTVADDFARMREIKTKGSVRTEPAEKQPWEALKRYVKDAKLERPEIKPDYFSTRDRVDMYVTTFDYVRLRQGEPSNSWGKDGAVVRMFGVTSEGHSGAMLVHNFWPYLYSEVPTKLMIDINENGWEAAKARFKEWLELQLKQRDVKKDAGNNPSTYVRDVELVTGSHRSIYYFQRDVGVYLKIETQLPRFVPLARDILSKRHFVPTEKGKKVLDKIISNAADVNYQPNAEEQAEDEQHEDAAMDTENPEMWMLPDEETLHSLEALRKPENAYGTTAVQVYECDIPFVLRFMIDEEVSGCGWVSVPRDAVQFGAINGVPIDPESGVDLRSKAQVSLAVDATKLVSLKERADVPDELRLISIDIESATSKTRQFPIPSSDPIICLSVNLYKIKDGLKPRARIGFAVGSTSPIERLTHCANFRADEEWSEETHARWSVEGRRDMLLALRWLMADAWDYDFMMGYNLPFDQSTCNKQADALGIGDAFRRYTRMADELCQSKVTSFSSKALGTRDTLAFPAAGRISWDILDQVKRDGSMKLRSNRLGTVAMEVAGVAKHEMPHQQIGPFWMMSPIANDDTRARVLSYNENDEYIAAVINARKAYIWNAHAAAQTTGVTIEMLMHRGAGIKSVSQLLRAARANKYLMPTYPNSAAKRTAAGFGVVPEGTLLRYEREINEELAKIEGMDVESADPTEREQEAIDRVNERFGIDPLLFSHNDSSQFATTAPGHEAANFARSMDTNKWYVPDEARAKSLTNAYNAARAKGGRLLLHFVNYVDPNKVKEAGKQKYYGVAQVMSRPEAGALDDGWSGVAPSATFRVRWLHRFATGVGKVNFNPDIPWRPALSSTAIPLQQRQARLLLDLCRLRRAVPKVELNLHGKPIEANTIEAFLRRKKRKRGEDGEEDDDEGLNVNRSIADEFDLPDFGDDDEEVDDDDDKYEGAVVLETIVGLYGVPVSTLDFASLYPSIMILHNLCYSTILTRELIRKYNLKESDKDPVTGKYVDPPNNDYTIKEAGHCVVNESVRKGLVPDILRNLLKKRSISKVFMGSAGKLKSHFIDKFKKNPLDPENWRLTEEFLVSGNGKERGESFVQNIQKLEKETGPILDRAIAQWAELKARIEASRYAQTLRATRSIEDTVKALRERSDAAGEVKDALEKFLESLAKLSANIRNQELLVDARNAFDALRAKVPADAPEWIADIDRLASLWDQFNAAYDATSADSLKEDTAPLLEALLFEISVLHQLFDARQNALKIAANSLYGFSGARVGKYPMRAIAEVTTSEGRISINKKRDLIERMFPLPKRFTYGPTLKDWEENGYVPRHVLEAARKLSNEEFEKQLADIVKVQTKAEAYGTTREAWRANRERVPAKELARMETEGNEEFDKHLKELEENGMRPIVIGGDTDSIFIIWPGCTKPVEAHALAQDAAKFVNGHFRKPQETTYEKTFYPAIYNAQKKYAGVMWEPGKPKPKQEPKIGGAAGETQDAIMCKGMENVRRDSTLEVCDAVTTTLRKVLVERRLEEAAAAAAELIELHRTQRADLSKLMLSKSLSKPPEEYHPKPIHAKVALKVNARNTGESYKVGDRVHFFVTQSDGKGEKTSEMGEDPSYVIENNVSLNTEYYLNKLLRPSLRRLLEPIRPGIMAFLFDGVPLSNGRLLKARSVLDGKEVTLSSGKDRPKELKNIKEGRLGSEHEASNATLRWAKKISAVDDSKIEAAVKAKIESMRKAIGFGHVPWNTPLILSKNWQNLDPALVEAEIPKRGSAAQQASMQAPQPSTPHLPGAAAAAAAPKTTTTSTAGMKRTSTLAGLGCARRICSSCGSRPIGNPKEVVCDSCKRGKDERLVEMQRAARVEAERSKAVDESVWKRCQDCAVGNIDNAVICGATDCDNFYTRKNSTRERAKNAAYLKTLQW